MEKDMNLWTLAVAVIIAYAAVVYLAILFAPPECEVTKDTTRVREFITECHEAGRNPTISQILDDYHMECDLDD
jgi:hypothetical protein